MDEYISRDDVLRKFIEGDGHDDDRFTEGYNFAVQEYREEVKKIPTADVQPVDRWISVKDRLPDATEATVLIWIKEGKADGIEISDCCHIGYWVKNSKEFCDMDWNVVSGITHWMPLPEPPKDGDAE